MQVILFFFIVIPSAIMHEYAHGWMANQLGDPTAKYAGRLTLNPKAHVDKWGTIFMPLILLLVSGGSFVFAYAKPVPYNPYNLKDPKWDPLKVAIAGPFSNFFLAFIFGLVFRFAPLNPQMLSFIFIVIFINVLLGVFNLVPIPPLDGSKVLYALLPESMFKVRVFMEQYGIFLLLVFIFFLFELIRPIINIFLYLFTGVPI